jgi:hypothetical protein
MHGKKRGSRNGATGATKKGSHKSTKAQSRDGAAGFVFEAVVAVLRNEEKLSRLMESW